MSRGGKREGSGRKSEDRVSVTMRVGRKTKERMALLRKEGVVIGHQVDGMVQRMCIDRKLISKDDV